MMLNNTALISAASVIVFLASAESRAKVIVDTSPDAIGAASALDASNVYAIQSFATQFSLATPRQLTGIDSYSAFDFGRVGFGTAVRVYGDSNGELGGLLHEIPSEVTVVDFDGDSSETYSRRHSPFELALAAGTYWIGVTSSNDGIFSQFAQLLVDDMPPRRHQTTLISGAGSTFLFPDQNGAYDQASIRVHAAVVPEPASIAFALASLTLLPRRRGIAR